MSHALLPLALVLLALPTRADVARPPRPAEPSDLAAHSLLIGVARAGERLVAVGAWGDVVLSDDGGRSWRQARFVPTRRTLTSVSFVSPEEGWAVGHDALVLHTRDGGETWEIQVWGPEEDAPLLSVWFENASHGIAVGGFGLLLETRDGGEHWERRRIHDEDEEPHLNDVFAAPDGTLFIAAEFGRVLRSRDGGDSWEVLHLPYEGSLWSGLAVWNGEPALLMLGMRGHVFRSVDGGDRWQEVETGTDQSLQGGTRLRDGTIVLVGHGGVVLTSRDGGRSFEVGIQPDRRAIAAVAEGRDGRILLFGEKGVTTAGETPLPAAQSAGS